MPFGASSGLKCRATCVFLCSVGAPECCTVNFVTEFTFLQQNFAKFAKAKRKTKVGAELGRHFEKGVDQLVIRRGRSRLAYGFVTLV